MNKNTIKNIVLSSLAATVLLACSNSSSSNNSKSFTGAVIDGYIKNATVCLDLNLDGICASDGSEPRANTNEKGEYSLNVSSEQQNHVNFSKAPIIASGGIDIDTGKNFAGKLESTKGDGDINLTPITTLVSKMVKKEIDSNSNLSDEQLTQVISSKKDAVKKVLKISSTDSDFIKAGDKDVNKAALQVQKTIELIAKASNNGNVSSSEVLDTVLDTFVDQIEELDKLTDVNEHGLSKLLDKTVEEVQKDSSKVRTLTGKVLSTNVSDNIKKVSNNIDEAFEKMQASNSESYDDLVDKIIVLVEDQVNKVENAIDENSVDDLVIDDYSDENFDDSVFSQSKDDFRKLGLQKELEFLKVSNASSVAETLVAESDPVVYAYNLYEVFESDEYSSLHTKYSQIKEKIDAYFAKIEEEQKEEEILSKNDFLELPDGKLYDFWYELDYDDNVYKKNHFIFEVNFNKSENTLTSKEYRYENSDWQESSLGYVLNNSQWIKESSALSIQINQDDNTVLIPQLKEKVAIVSEDDISNKKYYISSINKEITLPTNSKEYLAKFERTDDTYFLYEKVLNYSTNPSTSYTSFASIIENYCGNSFISKVNSKKGVAFAGTVGENGAYICNTSARSGNLVEVDYSKEPTKRSTEFIGTWEIKTVDSKEILVVIPNEPRKYIDSEEEFYTIFSLFDDDSGEAIFRGDMYKQGSIGKIVLYNEEAKDAIAGAIKTYIDEKNSFNLNIEMISNKILHFRDENGKSEVIFNSNGSFSEKFDESVSNGSKGTCSGTWEVDSSNTNKLNVVSTCTDDSRAGSFSIVFLEEPSINSKIMVFEEKNEEYEDNIFKITDLNGSEINVGGDSNTDKFVGVDKFNFTNLSSFVALELNDNSWYSKVTINNNQLVAEDYEQNDDGSFSKEGDFTSSISFTSNNSILNVSDSNTLEEWKSEVVETKQVQVLNSIEYSSLYRTKIKTTITKEPSQNFDWYSWDREYEYNEQTISNVEILKNALIAGGFYFNGEKNPLKLKSDGKVVKAIVVPNKPATPTSTVVGTWEIKNSMIEVDLDDKHIKLRVNNNLVQQTDFSKEGTINYEYYYSGDDLDKFIDSNFKMKKEPIQEQP